MQKLLQNTKIFLTAIVNIYQHMPLGLRNQIIAFRSCLDTYSKGFENHLQQYIERLKISSKAVKLKTQPQYDSLNDQNYNTSNYQTKLCFKKNISENQNHNFYSSMGSLQPAKFFKFQENILNNSSGVNSRSLKITLKPKSSNSSETSLNTSENVQLINSLKQNNNIELMKENITDLIKIFERNKLINSSQQQLQIEKIGTAR